ncbi:MAG TPA: ribosomal protein S5-alanine N-acetyltransferase [Fimbriimonas sp.]|nr:ribosomal protein S5-alanine N-acetyltransferase [Fimbriimonas sp.]
MSGVELVTKRLVVRTPRRGDGSLYAKYYTDNRDFLQPWSPTFRTEMFSSRGWEDSIPTILQHMHQGIAYRFCLIYNKEIIGVANVTDIKLNPFYGGIVGYTLSEACQGQGIMAEALEAIISYLFEEQNMHRLSAMYMPRNERSGRLLRKLGFQVEGYARDYLLIDGQWEDHVMTSLVNQSWRSPV